MRLVDRWAMVLLGGGAVSASVYVVLTSPDGVTPALLFSGTLLGWLTGGFKKHDRWNLSALLMAFVIASPLVLMFFLRPVGLVYTLAFTGTGLVRLGFSRRS